MIHDFGQCLKWSEKAGDEPFWDAAYRQFFPGLVTHCRGDGDTASQRMGIDRVVLLANGQVRRIDEKKRGREYDDFLLEFLSNDRTGAPGWIEKDLFIDFLAYAFIPSGKVYFFDWCLLRRAWKERGAEWKENARRKEAGYRLVIADNHAYKTHSIAVPRGDLFKAVGRASLVVVGPPTASEKNAQTGMDLR